VIQQGLAEGINDTSAAEILDLHPFVEQTQRVLQTTD